MLTVIYISAICLPQAKRKNKNWQETPLSLHGTAIPDLRKASYLPKTKHFKVIPLLPSQT